jgi:hypothetical protein
LQGATPPRVPPAPARPASAAGSAPRPRHAAREPAPLLDPLGGPAYKFVMWFRVALILVLTLLAAPLAAEAQKHTAKQLYRLGVLTPGSRPLPSFPTTAHLLPLILRELGYVEGQNLVIEQRFADGKLDRLPTLARELVQLPVDLLVVASPVAFRAAKDATKAIPIVMLLSYSDPVELGFVASLARPGGNITGVVMAAEPTMAAKRLELITEILPRATRIAAASSWSSSRLAAPTTTAPLLRWWQNGSTPFPSSRALSSAPTASGLSSSLPRIGYPRSMIGASTSKPVA